MHTSRRGFLFASAAGVISQETPALDLVPEKPGTTPNPWSTWDAHRAPPQAEREGQGARMAGRGDLGSQPGVWRRQGRQVPDSGGIDLPDIVAGQLAMGAFVLTIAILNPRVFGFHVPWLVSIVGAIFVHGAISTVNYDGVWRPQGRKLWRGRVAHA